MDLFPVWFSLCVSLAATVLTVCAGTPIAWVLARRRIPGKDLIGALVVTPLVLPPTVLGYYLLVLISNRGPIGRLFALAGIELAFTWRAAVVAAALGSFPLLVRTAQAAFETVDPGLEAAARTLGRYEWSVFWNVTLPLAWRGVTAGVVLAFCRAFGDFGITLMVAGNIPRRTQTLPLAIYDYVQSNAMPEANTFSLLAVVLVVALLVGLGRVTRFRY